MKAPLPDFRFEEGVLLSIRPFIHRVLSSPTSSTTCEKGKEIEQVEAEEKGASVSTNSITAEGTLDGETNDVFNGPLSIQWGQLTYVIFREQVSSLSPLYSLDLIANVDVWLGHLSITTRDYLGSRRIRIKHSMAME